MSDFILIVGLKKQLDDDDMCAQMTCCNLGDNKRQLFDARQCIVFALISVIIFLSVLLEAERVDWSQSGLRLLGWQREKLIRYGRNIEKRKPPDNNDHGITKISNRTRRSLARRPKIGTQIWKKITPTKVIVGAHLGTWAYRKYTNWAAGNGTAATANGTTIILPDADADADAAANITTSITNLKVPTNGSQIVEVMVEAPTELPVLAADAGPIKINVTVIVPANEASGDTVAAASVADTPSPGEPAS